MEGLGGADLLLGGTGNDTLTAYADADTLVGGAGSDVFRFDFFSLDGLDVIADFNGLPNGDRIDVSHMLIDFVPGVSDVSEFLNTKTTGGSTTLQVDVNGAASGADFVDLCVLQGVTTNLAGLLANGSIADISV